MKFLRDTIDSLNPEVVDYTLEEMAVALKYLEPSSHSFVSRDGIETLEPYDDEAREFLSKIDDSEFRDELKVIAERENQRLEKEKKIAEEIAQQQEQVRKQNFEMAASEIDTMKDSFDVLASEFGFSRNEIEALEHGDYLDAPKGRIFKVEGKSASEQSGKDVDEAIITQEKVNDALGIKEKDVITGTLGRENVAVLFDEVGEHIVLIDKEGTASSVDELRNRKLEKKVLSMSRAGVYKNESRTLLSTDFDHTLEVIDTEAFPPETEARKAIRASVPDDVRVHYSLSSFVVTGIGTNEFPSGYPNLSICRAFKDTCFDLVHGTPRVAVNKETGEEVVLREIKSSLIKKNTLDPKQKSFVVYDNNYQKAVIEPGLYIPNEIVSNGEYTRNPVISSDNRVDPKDYQFKKDSPSNELSL